VGGGDGTNAIRLCKCYPRLKVTILDLPTVCEIARGLIAEHNMSDRIVCVERNIFSDPWLEGCDGVLMSHFVAIFSEDKISFLYRSAFNILSENGKLFIWTLTSNDLEIGGFQSAKSSIYFLTTASGEGMAYPGKDHERWLRQAGFDEVRRY